MREGYEPLDDRGLAADRVPRLVQIVRPVFTRAWPLPS